MGKRWDVTTGDKFMVLDGEGRLLRGVTFADEDTQVYQQFYVHNINLTKAEKKKGVRCAIREGHGPFTVVPVTEGITRVNFLCSLIRENEWKRGAEIGVARGKTGLVLLSRFPDLHMTFVDCWPERFGKIRPVFLQAMHRFPPERFTFIDSLSHLGAEKVTDESLDFVFIDADHSEEACSKDIIAWLSKVKPDGWLMGHDANWQGVENAYTKLLKNVSVWRPDEVWYTKKSDQE